MLTTLLLVLAQTPDSCVERVSDLLLTETDQGSSEAADFFAAAEEEDLSPEALERLVEGFAQQRCLKRHPVLKAWLAWEARAVTGDFPRQKELESWARDGIRALTQTLNPKAQALAAMPGDELCRHAMTAVSKGLAALVFDGQPVQESKMVGFFAQACVAQKLGTTHRAALTCYAKVRPMKGFATLDAMDRCDRDRTPALDQWVTTTMKRFAPERP